MQGYWNHIPLLRYLIPFIAGIITAIEFGINYPPLYYYFGASLFIYCLLLSIKKSSRSFRLQVYYGLILHLLLVAAGICAVMIHTPVFRPDYFMRRANSESVFICRINKPAEETEKSYRLFVDVNEIVNKDSTSGTTGTAILYVRKDSTHNVQFRYGDVIYIKNKFTEPEQPRNPNEFNYRKYLNHLEIYHIAFLDQNEIIKSDENKSRFQWTILFECRDYFLWLMNKYVRDENSKSVGEALILGTKTAIDDNVRQAYANTGTMHILAVSGLHVGILFIILEFLFKPFKIFSKKRSRAAFAKTIFILIIIWLYACLTGMSPSVMRSAVMFSFLAIGRLFERHIDSFNIIFASAIPLLICNPYQITEVGFQLSYLAVGGIVFFQPLISKLWKPVNAILKYLWSMTTVSIAAQLATSPISIYYFHQFPNYFLLSNLIAIPVSFVVLILGVAFFVGGLIPFVNQLLGISLDWSLRLLNGSVIAVDKLPHSVTGNLYLNTPETIAIYFMLITLGGFAILKQKKYLILSMIFVFCALMSISFRLIQEAHTEKITFYSAKNIAAISLLHGSSCEIFTNTDSLESSDEFKFHIRNDLIANGIKEINCVNYTQQKSGGDSGSCYYKFPLLIIGDNTFYFLTKENARQQITHADKIDYVIMTGNPWLKIDTTLQFSNAEFIIDNANSRKSINYWKKQFDKQNIKYHLISDQSLTIELNDK